MADKSEERLFVAIYTDADVHGILASHIRLRGFDALSAYQAGNAALNDPDQLAFAASQGRAILTCNDDWLSVGLDIPFGSRYNRTSFKPNNDYEPEE